MAFFGRRNWGMLLLGIWLILVGLLPLLSIGNPTSTAIVHLLAIAAGLLILLDR